MREMMNVACGEFSGWTSLPSGGGELPVAEDRHVRYLRNGEQNHEFHSLTGDSKAKDLHDA
jgi:hypothetical protein